MAIWNRFIVSRALDLHFSTLNLHRANIKQVFEQVEKVESSKCGLVLPNRYFNYSTTYYDKL